MGVGTGVLKYVMFIVDLVFALCGLAMIIYGLFFKANYKSDSPWGLVILGTIIFLISFLGCWGAIRESTCLLTTYGVIMIILFVLQILIGLVIIYVYSATSSVSTEWKNEIRKEYQDFISNKNTKFAEYQENFNCCGVDGPEDYNWPNHTLPESCCVSTKNRCLDNKCPCVLGVHEIYDIGCLELEEYIIALFGNMAIIVMVIGIIELIVGLCALWLRNAFRRQWNGRIYA